MISMAGAQDEHKLLWEACKNGDEKTLRQHIVAGADVNYQGCYTPKDLIHSFTVHNDRDNTTAWYNVAVDRGKLPRFLRDKETGGITNPAEYGEVIKHGSGSNPDEFTEKEIKELTSEDGVDKDMTLLHVAVLHDREDMVRILLEHEADVTIKDHFGHTPIALATTRGNERIVKLFHENGAKELQDGTAELEELAMYNGHDKVARYLKDLPYYDICKKLQNGPIHEFETSWKSAKGKGTTDQLIALGKNNQNIFEMFLNLKAKVKDQLEELQNLEDKTGPRDIRDNLTDAATDLIKLRLESGNGGPQVD